MQRMPPGPAVARAAQRLAVNRHDFLFDLLMQYSHHRRQTAQELIGLQSLEDAGERVRRRNAVGQFQEAIEPVPLGAARARQVFPRVALADRAAHGDRHEVHQVVPPRPRHTRVCPSCKAVRQNLQTGLRRHGVAPSVPNLPRTGNIPALDETTFTAFITPLQLDAEALPSVRPARAIGLVITHEKFSERTVRPSLFDRVLVCSCSLPSAGRVREGGRLRMKASDSNSPPPRPSPPRGGSKRRTTQHVMAISFLIRNFRG